VLQVLYKTSTAFAIICKIIMGNSGDVIQGCAVGVQRIVAQGVRYIKSIHIDPYSCIMILANEKQT
jgi:hypothetical protein